jgi:hypothetical protein
MPAPSIFAGMTTVQLQAALTAAQQAYLALASGSKGETFSYTQGDGAKSVTFSRANLGALTMLIKQLQVELGVICQARRPIRFVF